MVYGHMPYLDIQKSSVYAITQLLRVETQKFFDL